MEFNTILIVFDTLRKDSIFPYNPTINTPVLKKFVEDSTVFPNPISPASWTPPAHGSIFTGKYPSKSGIHEDLVTVADFSYLMDNYSGKTLSELFSEKGYNTYKFSQNGLIGSDTGFSRGFDFNEYTPNYFQDHYTSMLDNYNYITSRWGYSKGQVFMSALRKWDLLDLSKRYLDLKKETNFLMSADKSDKGGIATIEKISSYKLKEPFFLFINLMDMHDPHDNISMNLNWQDSVFGDIPGDDMRKKITESYIQSAASLDTIIAKLLTFLKSNGYIDNTVVALTSDHGQSIFEEMGYYGHGNLLLDRIVEVPLIIKVPGKGKIKTDLGYQSTSRLYDFLPQIATENLNYDSITSEICFSESYGTIDKNVAKYKNKTNFQDVYKKINSIRKVIFKDGYKLVLNLSNGTVEEFKKNCRNITTDSNKLEFRQLVEEIKTFSWNEDLCYPE